MSPRPMVITKVTFKNSTQMTLVDDNHVVQAFSANTSDNPFRIAVLPGTPGGYRNLSDTQSIDSCRKILAVDPIAISHQVARHRVVGKRFHNLLGRPSRGRVFRNIKMQNTTAVMRENAELG